MNLLVTGAWNCKNEQIEYLKKAGHSVLFMQNESENLPCDANWVEGVICNGLFLHHEINKFLNLRYIQLTSAGFDRVPIEYIKEKNMEIHNAKGVYSIPMAEYALAGVLQIYKKTSFFSNNQKKHIWEKNREIEEIFAKKVCILGCGNVGYECAVRFKAFGCAITGVDLEESEDSTFGHIFPFEKIDKALEDSDIIVITLPLTIKTNQLFDRARFKKLKRGAVLVNISRGGVVNTEAMLEALKSNLSGAVLDVFEQEPLIETSPLWDLENVIITPHNSFVGDGNQERLFEVIKNNIKGK